MLGNSILLHEWQTVYQIKCITQNVEVLTSVKYPLKSLSYVCHQKIRLFKLLPLSCNILYFVSAIHRQLLAGTYGITVSSNSTGDVYGSAKMCIPQLSWPLWKNCISKTLNPGYIYMYIPDIHFFRFQIGSPKQSDNKSSFMYSSTKVE